MHQSNISNANNKSRTTIPELFKDDGSILSMQEAEEVALNKFSFGSGWRNNDTSRSNSSKNSFKDRLKRMKHLVKTRKGGVLGFFTAPPDGVSQLTDKEIANEAQKINLSYYSPDIVKCFNDIISGGRFLPPSLWLDEVRKRKLSIPNTQAHLNGLLRTIKAIDYDKIPGKTSLEKAVATVKLLGTIDSSALVDDGSGDCQSFFANSKRQSDAINKLNNALELAEGLDEAEVLLLGGSKAGMGHNDTMELTVEVIEALLNNKAAQLITKVARILQKLPKLKIQGEKTVQKDRNGVEIRSRQMESINELPKIAKTNWALFMEHPELFWSKALNLEYPVREHISRQGQKQLLYLLIDSSGSMQQANRVQLALAVLLNRLKGVLDGEASLLFRFFDSRPFPEHKITNSLEAKDSIEKLRSNNFSGGGTNITYALREAVNSIESNQANNGGIKPQIAIVSDGEDGGFSFSVSELKEITLHAFLIGSRNSDLESLAKQSGGIAVALGDDGDVRIL